MDSKLIMTVEEMQDREAWLKLRDSGLGGSDAGVILGLSHFKSPFTLWLEKTGQKEPDDLSSNMAVRMGNKLEPVVAEIFEEETGKKVRKCGLMQHKEYPWLLASVDRLVVNENAGLEIKTAGVWGKDLWKNDEIPDTYYAQCLHYMLATGADRWYIACLIGGQEYICKCIERKDVEEDIASLLEAEKHWWQTYVVERQLPPVDGSDQCTSTLRSLYKGGDTEAAELDSHMDSLCQKIEDIKEAVKKLKDEQTLYENEVRVAMMNADFGRTATYNVWYKAGKPRESFDKERFMRDCPGVYEKYIKATPVRTLRIIKKAEFKNK